MKVRQNLYLDRERGDALAAGNHGNKSHLVNDALRDWLARELDGKRRDIDVLLEILSTFVRSQLMVTAPLPEADAIGRAIGRNRFQSFVAQVGRQIAAGTRTLALLEQKEGRL